MLQINVNENGKIKREARRKMENLLNEQFRLAILLTWLFVLCGLEFIVPLVKPARETIFKTIPNLVLTVLLLLMNLVLALASGGLIGWTSQSGFGPFNWLGVTYRLPELLPGIAFLDFVSAYLPHVLFHKIGWLWRFHSVSNRKNEIRFGLLKRE
jgi:sterol desaturase/sphingolipid hydroxylase (fatty acid hydroxylase superfamily)